MANEGQKAPGAAVEAAIAYVLARERDARAAIESAGREAALMAEGARAASRAIAERNDARIRKVRAAFEQALSMRLGELRSAEVQIDTRHELSDEDRARVDGAIDRLVSQLTGGAS